MKLTQAEYLAKGGLACPFCGSGDVEVVDSVEVDAGQAWQEVGCNTCNASWTDQYALTGFNPNV